MSELVEKVARAIKDNAELDEWEALTPTTQAWYVAQARAAIREVLAAQAEWARTASPSDVGDPDFFEEGLRGFAREHGIEMGKDED